MRLLIIIGYDFKIYLYVSTVLHVLCILYRLIYPITLKFKFYNYSCFSIEKLWSRILIYSLKLTQVVCCRNNSKPMFVSPFLLNLLWWHWLPKLHRFQVHNKTSLHCIVCSQPKSSLCPSTFMSPHILPTSLHTLPLAISTLLFLSMRFFSFFFSFMLSAPSSTAVTPLTLCLWVVTILSLSSFY